LVDFFASWCGPCKLQGPIIDQLAEKMGDKAIIGKINVEEAAKTSEEYGVMSIPTLVIFKDGKIVENFTGLQSIESLTEQIKKLL
jgi:thioredoxin 1